MDHLAASSPDTAPAPCLLGPSVRSLRRGCCRRRARPNTARAHNEVVTDGLLVWLSHEFRGAAAAVPCCLSATLGVAETSRATWRLRRAVAPPLEAHGAPRGRSVLLLA